MGRTRSVTYLWGSEIPQSSQEELKENARHWILVWILIFDETRLLNRAQATQPSADCIMYMNEMEV